MMSLEVCFSGEVLVAEATEPLLDPILILHHGASHGFELFGILATEEFQVSPLILLFFSLQKIIDLNLLRHFQKFEVQGHRQLCCARQGGPRALSKRTNANLACVYKNTKNTFP